MVEHVKYQVIQHLTRGGGFVVLPDNWNAIQGDLQDWLDRNGIVVSVCEKKSGFVGLITRKKRNRFVVIT